MTANQSDGTEADDTEETDSEMAKPGGGPDRVVSDSSVDEVVSSLEDDSTDAESVEDVLENGPDPSGGANTGPVTGADVRAAETEEGRESTPEIDEIELSVDDLDDDVGEIVPDDDIEASSEDDSTAESTADDAGAEESAESETDQPAADTADSGSGGLLGWLRGLFSG